MRLRMRIEWLKIFPKMQKNEKIRKLTKFTSEAIPGQLVLHMCLPAIRSRPKFWPFLCLKAVWSKMALCDFWKLCFSSESAVLRKHIFRTVNSFLCWSWFSMGKKGTVRFSFSLASYRGKELHFENQFGLCHRHLKNREHSFLTIAVLRHFWNSMQWWSCCLRCPCLKIPIADVFRSARPPTMNRKRLIKRKCKK